MQAIRILSGTHAGAQVSLKRRHYRLGGGDDADICLTDWSSEPLDLVLKSGKAGMLLAVPPSGRHGPTVRPLARLKDFAPVRMGGIALCLGPAGRNWPADAELLERLQASAMRTCADVPGFSGGRSAATPKRTGRLVASTLLLAGMGLAGVSTAVPEVRHPAVAPASLAERVAQRLHDAGVEGAKVRSGGVGAVVVEGLLGDAQAVARVRGALTGLEAPAGQSVRLQVAAASELAQSIADALDEPQLSVSYRGHGFFAIGGRARDPDALRRSAQRLATDLAPLVRGIGVEVAEVAASPKVDGGAMLADKDVQYVQLRNGIRHLSGLGIEPVQRQP